jgi:hypothetical protein
MAQTVANFTDVLKEVWTQDRLERQFYDENPFLDRLEKTNKYTIGKQAQVPIHKGRAGGTSIFSSAGGTLNAADEQKVDQASYTLSYNWQRVDLQFGVLNQGDGGTHSVAAALDLEVEGAIADQRKSVMRQAVSNGDALIAQCTTGGSGSVCNLLATGYGYDAIVRGWLYPELLVDVGTTADEVAISDGVRITAVSEDATTPSITLSTAPTGEDTTHYVSVANARSGTTSNEMNGLRQIAGSTTAALGGLDPDTAGEEFWKPAQVDSSTTVLSLDLLLTLQRNVFQKGGKFGTYVLTSPKQLQNIYSQLQSQVRFTGDKQLEAGGVQSVSWNNMAINAFPDVPDRELYMLTIEDFLIVTGAYSKPTWASDIEGSNKGLTWTQGATNFQDAVVYALNLGVKRRNTHSAATALTA